MKHFLAVAALALPLAFSGAIADGGKGKDKDKGSKPPKKDKDRGGEVVAAPEIDAAAGTLAIALAGGGMALLARSRRKQTV